RSIPCKATCQSKERPQPARPDEQLADAAVVSHGHSPQLVRWRASIIESGCRCQGTLVPRLTGDLDLSGCITAVRIRERVDTKAELLLELPFRIVELFHRLRVRARRQNRVRGAVSLEVDQIPEIADLVCTQSLSITELVRLIEAQRLQRRNPPLIGDGIEMLALRCRETRGRKPEPPVRSNQPAAQEHGDRHPVLCCYAFQPVDASMTVIDRDDDRLWRKAAEGVASPCCEIRLEADWCVMAAERTEMTVCDLGVEAVVHHNGHASPLYDLSNQQWNAGQPQQQTDAFLEGYSANPRAHRHMPCVVTFS